ncbi:MAG: hypothetical protein Q6364_12890 [Candidatus Hermodarchaeota archaeon]|nr:hypothetical protein [Candidatus Hermodarchaeota archaeon]
MRETQSADTLKLWILSINKPHHILAIIWVVFGCLFIVIGIQPFFFFPSFPIFLHLDLLPLLFVAGVGVFFILSAGFLVYDSQSIHNDPFPEGSSCKLHPDKPAYDWCALCGTLTCPEELVRIQQKFWGTSPGMFGFDGVACQDCAQRRVKRFFMIFIPLLLLVFPLLIISGVNLIILGPVHLVGVLVFTFSVVVFGLVCLFGWLFWKVWRIVTTPLSQQPERTIPITARLVKRGTVDGKTVFKK